MFSKKIAIKIQAAKLQDAAESFGKYPSQEILDWIKELVQRLENLLKEEEK